MAAKEEMCSSCFENTKYKCLLCGLPFCMRCSVFENNEDVPGWAAGKAVAYCEVCFTEKMEEEEVKASQDHRSFAGESKKRARIEDDDNSSDDEDNESELLASFVKKAKNKAKKNKGGRRSTWSPEEVDDLVDVIVNNAQFQRKLIFINTRNQRNSDIYEKILKEMKERASERGTEFTFGVSQMRTKFKKLVSECKGAAMTIKTATGIRRFQEEQGYGKWFQSLYALVKTRDSCQPEQAHEPSATAPPPQEESQENSSSTESSSPHLFVPVKSHKKRKSDTELGNVISESLNVIKDLVNNDPTKELMSFLKDEMEKSREHELKMLQLIANPMPNTSFAPPQTPQHGYQRNHQPGETTNSCPQWQEYWRTPNHRPSTSTFDNFSAGASTYYEL